MKKEIRVAGEALEWLYSPDWEYHDYGDCKRHLQMIIPCKRQWGEGEKYPLILFIPGSAWYKQELYNDIPKLAKLAERGFAVAVMEYRESTIAAFPAQVEDVSHAIHFLREKAEQLHLDAEQLYLMGNSSGGHIAMMAALLNAHGLCRPFPAVQGVICESGSTDLLVCAKAPLPPWMKKRPSADLLGVEQIEDHEELARKASCAMYIREETVLPPVLLLHSEHDPVVSAENSHRLHDQLEKTKHQVLYVELKDNDAHGGGTFFCKQIIDIIEGFIRQCKGC